LQLDSDPAGPDWNWDDDDGRLYFHVDADDLERDGVAAPVTVTAHGAALKRPSA